MTSGSPSFEKDAQKLAVSLERYRYLVLVLITILYATGVVRHAAGRALWYDEIITVMSASAPDFAGTLKIAKVTDASPPLTHVLTHIAMRWFGSSEVAIRLPAMVGFWVFCLCLFHLVRRRAGIYYAFVALLMPIATEAYRYAFEARAYGPELGFCGLMLVAWQMACDGRRVAGPVLPAVSFAAALMLQYYAVLLYIPLAGAELYRTWRERRWNWGVWAAFVCGIAPLVWRLATIRSVVDTFSRTTWAPAYLGQVVEFWELMLPHPSAFAAGLGVLALTLIGNRQQDEPVCLPKLYAPEVVAGVLFFAIPTASVAIGLFKTHMFTPRYALVGVTGVFLLLPVIAARLSRGRAFAGFLLMGLSTLPLLFEMVIVPDADNPVAQEATLIKALDQGPVVVPDGQLFLKMWYYAPEPLKSKLLFLVDYEAAVQYMGFDSIDRGVEVLKSSAAVQVLDYKDFAAPGREFRLYQNWARPGWLLAKVVADGASTRIEQYSVTRQLIQVRLKE